MAGPGSIGKPRASAATRLRRRALTLPEGLKKKPLTESNGAHVEICTPLTADNVEEIWAQLLRGIGSLLRSDLEKAGIPAIFGPNTLVIRFPARYNQAREYCQKPDPIERIEQALRKLTAQRWQIRVEGVPKLTRQ